MNIIHKTKKYRGVQGVYGIRNVVDGKIYIGSTARGIGERICEHLSSLRRELHFGDFTPERVI